jgi:hypothetical protein
MNSSVSTCLTRVVVDDDRDIAIAQLPSVVQRIQHAVCDIPVSQREYVANALLNMAVAQMLQKQEPGRLQASARVMTM